MPGRATSTAHERGVKEREREGTATVDKMETSSETREWMKN